MSQVVVCRNAFLPSSGDPAVTPAFDAFWLNTSVADRMGGLYDVKSDTPFLVIGPIAQHFSAVENWTPGSHREYYRILVRQYVFPEFGVLEQYGASAPYEWFSWVSGIPAHTGGPVRLKAYGTYTEGSGPIVPPSGFWVGTQTRASVVDSSGTEVARFGQSYPLTGMQILGHYAGWHPTEPTACDWQPQQYNHHIHPAETDRLVLDVGFFATSFITSGVVPADLSVYFVFGDEGTKYLDHRSVEDDNPGFALVHWVQSFGGAADQIRFSKAMRPTRSALRIQHPPVPPTGDFLGEEFFG